MGDVYVLALMGTSPGVITELLWHLVVRQGLRVVGVEVWTTGKERSHDRAGQAHLPDLCALYGTLVRTLGEQAASLPPAPDALELRRPDSDFGAVRAFGFRREGGAWLNDIDDDTVAAAVAEQLDARVRQLVASVGRVDLVGSVAGGRKTMGASLQTAFALHGRPNDRLVHVLLHSDFEDYLRSQGELGTFACPTEAVAGFSPERQLTVHDVVFPRMQWLAHDLAVRLAKVPYAELCRGLQAGEADRATVTPVGEGCAWLEVWHGPLRLFQHRLGKRQRRAVELLASRGEVPEGELTAAFAEITKRERAGRADPAKALQRLAAVMADHPFARAIRPFTPLRSDHVWRLHGAACVELKEARPTR